jgi:hypothetical protein
VYWVRSFVPIELGRELHEVARLLDRRHHRGHDPQVGFRVGIGLGERGELLAQEVLVGAQRPQAAEAQGGVVLVRVVEELERFVGAGIEHPHDHLLAREV